MVARSRGYCTGGIRGYSGMRWLGLIWYNLSGLFWLLLGETGNSGSAYGLCTNFTFNVESCYWCRTCEYWHRQTKFDKILGDKRDGYCSRGKTGMGCGMNHIPLQNVNVHLKNKRRK
jgi:hypothetical protein